MSTTSSTTPRSSLKTGRNRQFLSESERMMREFTQRNGEFASGETHHIIKFKANKGNVPNDGNYNGSNGSKKQGGGGGRGAISKARQAIKKRLSKKEQDESKKNSSSSSTNNKKRSKSKSRSYAVEKGIEASIKFDRNETFLNKTIPKTLSKLKPGSGSGSSSTSTRGRSLERRKSFGGGAASSLSNVGQSLRRSLSMKRSKSLKRPLSMNHRSMSLGRSRSFSRGRGRSPHNPGFLEKVKSFRRDRSILSVRSTRSNFSVGRRLRQGDGGGGGNRFMRFFRRRKNQKEPCAQEKVVFVKQVYTPQTVPADDEDVGFLDGLLCSSLDVTVCRDLFCRAEDVEDEDDHPLSHEDDIRDFGEDYHPSKSQSFERGTEELFV